MARYLSVAAALAVTGAAVLTPELLLSTVRRTAADPSPDGSVALFSYSQYSFEEHASAGSGMNLIDLKTGDITDSGLNASEINEVVWLPGTETGIIYINGTNEEIPGGVTLWIGDIKSPNTSTLVASLDAPYSGLKVANTSSGDLHFLVNSMAYPNGTAVNPETEVTPASTARYYSDVYVRHWDTWLTKNRYAVFAGALSANNSYALSGAGMRNLNHGINFTATQSETPIQPFGDLSDYDLSPDGSIYAFVSKAPQLNKANYTASYAYVGAFASSEAPVAFNGPDSEAAKAGHKGASGLPSFSWDSSKLAYVQQDEDYYESDRWILYTVDVAVEGSGVAVSNWKSLSAGFDRWVQGPIIWAEGDESIFVTAEDYARVKVFNFPITADESFVPEPLTSNTTVASYAVLPDGSLFVSATAIWTPNEWYILANGTKNTLFDASQVDPNLAGLGAHTVSEFFFNGSNPDLKQQLHSWVIKPSNYKDNVTYPLAFYIHGGPQGSWANGWSNRWNPQVWADQGYIVVAPNPTGSTGFGQYVTDSIQGNWGGWPYEDLVNAWNYVNTSLPCADTVNGIAAGASYGGYMTNWIQANDLGNEFKAIVTHDGISNTQAAWATEELWFIRHDYNGSIWNSDAYAKWNPQNHIANFSTPQFIVHNTKDYRLPESDGISMFNILQGLGIPSRFMNFPDENHWVLKQENSLVWHTEIFNWINHYAKGEPLSDTPVGN
ncbi:alpha/beta-hydrolase [Clathrospora elynae]|uniref:Dipeptidyl-peptidase V n=1 Tax=Clathrospora elynae TaxID=706981 RepID=A0A6A5SGV4_9PLEO|nr:alpha/beta-hydrolase [Clathrospora elynae]